MKKSIVLAVIFLVGTSGFAKDCGIAPPGFSFGPNCEMKKSVDGLKSVVGTPAAVEDKTRWEQVRFMLKSGKPGYTVALGADFKLVADAILMNEIVTDDIDRVFVRAALGSHRTCEASGLHQPIGFTVFKVRNCR